VEANHRRSIVFAHSQQTTTGGEDIVDCTNCGKRIIGIPAGEAGKPEKFCTFLCWDLHNMRDWPASVRDAIFVEAVLNQ
jgi:hypothetical protein